MPMDANVFKRHPFSLLLIVLGTIYAALGPALHSTLGRGLKTLVMAKKEHLHLRVSGLSRTHSVTHLS